MPLIFPHPHLTPSSASLPTGRCRLSSAGAGKRCPASASSLSLSSHHSLPLRLNLQTPSLFLFLSPLPTTLRCPTSSLLSPLSLVQTVLLPRRYDVYAVVFFLLLSSTLPVQPNLPLLSALPAGAPLRALFASLSGRRRAAASDDRAAAHPRSRVTFSFPPPCEVQRHGRTH